MFIIGFYSIQNMPTSLYLNNVYLPDKCDQYIRYDISKTFLKKHEIFNFVYFSIADYTKSSGFLFIGIPFIKKWFILNPNLFFFE